jgi:ABC-type multidrug transport system ATPase subunit
MAHRPSAISEVDQLLMLKDGRQMAFGPKEEVLKSMTHQSSSGDAPKAAPAAANAPRQQATQPPQTVSRQQGRSGFSGPLAAISSPKPKKGES